MPRNPQSLAVPKPIIKKLTADEKAFVRAYVECKCNGTRAMLTLDSTLDPVKAQRIGSSYLMKARVRRAIDKRIAATSHIAGPREVMAHLSDVATSEWRDFAKADDVRVVTRQVIISVPHPDRPGEFFQASVEVPVEEHAYFQTNPTPKVKALETLAKIHKLDRDPLLERLQRMTGRMLDQLERGRQDQLLRESEDAEDAASADVVDAQLALPAPVFAPDQSAPPAAPDPDSDPDSDRAPGPVATAPSDQEGR